MKLFPVINNIDNGFINLFGETEVFYWHKSLPIVSEHENKWTATEAQRGIKENLRRHPFLTSHSFH